jgi:predicted membrane protein
VNVVYTASLIRVLEDLAGAIVFPVGAVGSLLRITVGGVVFRRERHALPALLGTVLGTVGPIVANR